MISELYYERVMFVKKKKKASYLRSNHFKLGMKRKISSGKYFS